MKKNQPSGAKTIQPNPGPQTALLQSACSDVFFGGSRFGGKSYALLLDFAAHAEKYGKNAVGVIFRRSIPELDELVRISNEIYLPLGWRFQIQKSTWTAPNGATLRMRHLSDAADYQKYHGHSFSYMGFDEIGGWDNPTPIDQLWSCLRSGAGVPCVRRCTGNPGGAGMVWIKKRYIEGRTPYVPFKWAPLSERPDLLIESVFIPSTLDDNPAAASQKGEYEARLAASGNAKLYRAWRYGDWDVFAGQFFDIFDKRIHVKDGRLFPIQPWWPRWMSGDWGLADDAVFHWHTMDENGVTYTYRELLFDKDIATADRVPDEVGREILRVTPPDERIRQFYFSPDAFHQRQSVHTIADRIGQIVRDRGLPYPAKADDDRVGGWTLMYQMLAAGTWFISDSCKSLIESLPSLVRDEKKPEDCAESKYDHAPDSARYGLKSHLGTARIPVNVQILAKIKDITDFTSKHIAHRRAESEFRKKSAFLPRRSRYLNRGN